MDPHWSQKITGAVGSTASIVIHTIFFVLAFVLVLFGVPFDRVLLVLTTIVSLEAIYLSLFIQMTVNRHTQSLAEVGEDIDEIQEDIDEIQEDVGEISDEVEEIAEDIEEITEELENDGDD